MSMDSAEPSWAETTVRWLNSKRNYFSVAHRHLPYPEQLALFLNKTDHCNLSPGMGMEKRNKVYMDIANFWQKGDHLKFVADKEILASKKKSTTPKLATDSPDGTEEARLDMENFAVLARKPKPSASAPKQEKLLATENLDEIVAQQVLQSDPRYGAW